jgi:hypothetical protein
MSISWDWIIFIALFAGGSLLAFKYYQGQADKYRDGKHNEAMDKFRGGGGSCCH